MEKEQLRKNQISPYEISKELAPIIQAQWYKSNAKFVPPVILKVKSLVYKVESVWKKVEKVAQGYGTKAEKVKVEDLLDKLLDITTCPHTIILCNEVGSGCSGQEDCKIKAQVFLYLAT